MDVNDIEAETGNSLLKLAVQDRRYELIEFLLAAKADPYLENNTGWSALKLVRRDNIGKHKDGVENDELQTLFCNYEDDESWGFSPLHEAVLGLEDLAVERVLRDPFWKAQVDIKDSCGLTALHWAASRGYRDATKELLDVGASPDSTDHVSETPLHDAVKDGHIACIELLLEYDADPNVKNHYGDTPLYKACRFHDDPSLVELLTSHGADLHMKNDRGLTPLHACAPRNRVLSARHLVNNGAHIDVTDADGDTVLFNAIFYTANTLVGVLLEHGANAQHVNNCGQTLLHVLAMSGNLGTVQVVSNYSPFGLDGSVRNKAGRTPLDILSDRSSVDDHFREAFYELCN